VHGNVATIIMRSEMCFDLASKAHPPLRFATNLNLHHAPAEKMSEFGSTKSPVSATCIKNRDELRDLLIRGFGTRHIASLMYVPRIPMPKVLLQGPRRGPGSPKGKSRNTLSLVLRQAVISPVRGSTDGLIGKSQNPR
jgi:hypothetical protein